MLFLHNPTDRRVGISITLKHTPISIVIHSSKPRYPQPPISKLSTTQIHLIHNILRQADNNLWTTSLMLSIFIYTKDMTALLASSFV